MGMNHLTLACATLCVIFSASASATPKPQLPLEQPAVFDCAYPSPYRSSWEDSNHNSASDGPGNPDTAKYGGDLVTTVHYSWTCDNPEASGEADLSVETDLSTDPSQIYSYSCSDPDVDDDYFDHVCTGNVNVEDYIASLNAAAAAAAQAQCPDGHWTYDSSIVGLSGGVKSIDPGKSKGRQNYPITYANEACSQDVSPPPFDICGNGVVVAPEQCDDGNTANGDGCSAVCTIESAPVCGNAILEGPEQCDDGNTANGDGCSAVCTLE